MSDLISRQAAIDALDVLCQEHRYKIHGKIETYSQYNEAWQDALDRAEGAIFNLPSVQPEPQYKTKHGYIWLCPKCGLLVHSDYIKCVRCGHNREKGV